MITLLGGELVVYSDNWTKRSSRGFEARFVPQWHSQDTASVAGGGTYLESLGIVFLSVARTSSSSENHFVHINTPTMRLLKLGLLENRR